MVSKIWDKGDGETTSWMCAEDLNDGFGINADALDARDEIAAVALEKNAIFGPVVVDVVLVPDLLELTVALCFRIEDEAAGYQYFTACAVKLDDLPSAHDVAVTTEDFGQTAHNNVCVWKDVDVDEVSYSLVDYYAELVLVGETADALQVG